VSSGGPPLWPIPGAGRNALKSSAVISSPGYFPGEQCKKRTRQTAADIAWGGCWVCGRRSWISTSCRPSSSSSSWMTSGLRTAVQSLRTSGPGAPGSRPGCGTAGGVIEAMADKRCDYRTAFLVRQIRVGARISVIPVSSCASSGYRKADRPLCHNRSVDRFPHGCRMFERPAYPPSGRFDGVAWHVREGVEMYSLGEAAKAAGRAKSTILRDIRRGKLSAARTETGGYQIEPAELARAYPLERSIQRSSNGASNDSQPGPATVEVDRLLDQISDLRETIRDLRDRLDASGAERRHESEEHRRVQERLTGLLTHRQAGSVPPVMPRVRMPWWRRWFN
jgi:hypothetical protein